MNETNVLKGGGIIFTSIHNDKLYFLLGRENKYCNNGAGKWCDFGGGIDDNEKNIIESVSREASEEITGFFGDKNDIYSQVVLNKKRYYIDNNGYRIFIIPMKYDENLPYYFNNNQKVLQKYVPNKLLKTSKIFEKDKIKYFTINELKKNQSVLRKFFKESVKKIINQEKDIKSFVMSFSFKKEKDNQFCKMKPNSSSSRRATKRRTIKKLRRTIKKRDK